MKEKIRILMAKAPEGLSPEAIRAAEVAVLGAYEDFVIYTTPEVMAEKCDFIYGWLLDVPGDQHTEPGPNDQLRADGWEEMAYMGTFGKKVYRYRKQIRKEGD